MLGPASNGLVSTTWGLSGVTESDRPVLGFAPVALSSYHIVTSGNESAFGLSGVARKDDCWEIIFCIREAIQDFAF